MYAESHTESTHGSQGTVQLFPRRGAGRSPEHGHSRLVGSAQVHLVEIRLAGEGAQEPGQSYPTGRFCVSISLQLSPASIIPVAGPGP